MFAGIGKNMTFYSLQDKRRSWGAVIGHKLINFCSSVILYCCGCNETKLGELPYNSQPKARLIQIQII